MNFPSSPTLNQTYTFEGKTWKWNGQGWQLVPSSSFPWSGLTGVPAEFPPEAHAHEISDVTGLQTALNGKAASSHSHAISDVTGLQTALDGKAASSHSHAISNVTGLQSALDGKQPVGSYEASGTAASAVSAHELASDPHPQYTSAAEAAAAAPVQSVAGRTGAVTLAKADVGLGNVDNTSDANKPISTATQSALDGKAASSHTHAIANVTGLQAALDGKAASSHTHAISDVTNLQTTLDGKAASSHTHTISDVTGLQTALDGKISANSELFRVQAEDIELVGELLVDGVAKFNYVMGCKGVRYPVIAMEFESNTTRMDLSKSLAFFRSMYSNLSLSLSNENSSLGAHVEWTLLLNYSSGTLTLPSGYQWVGGAAPTLVSGLWLIRFVKSSAGGSNLLIASAQKMGA